MTRDYKTVTNLQLASKQISEIAVENQVFRMMSKLIELNLGGNKIKTIERLQDLKSLRSLNLTDNLIERIENLNLPLLQYLYLDRNKITAINNLNGVKKLECLTLAGNKVTSPNLKGSELLVQLNQLDVSDN